MGLFSSIGKQIKTTANIATSIFANPIGAVKAVATGKTAVQFAKEQTAQPLSKQITQTVVSGLTYATISSGVANIATKGVASLIPSTITGKVIASVATPIVVGAVASNPLKAVESIASVPQSLGNIGVNVATFASNPSIENAKSIITENPVVSTLLAVGGAVAVGAGVSGVVASAINTQATRANTKAVQENLIPQTPSVVEVPKTSATDGGNVPITPTGPITPQTVYLDDKPSSKRRKTSSKPRRTTISQKTNIIINQQNKSYSVHRKQQKYLNAIPY